MVSGLVAGCFAVSPVYQDGLTVERIDERYIARDDCLRRAAAAINDGTSDPTMLAPRIAADCQTETDALIVAIAPLRDPDVVRSVNQDSRFRAAGFVLKLRREGSPPQHELATAAGR